MADVPTRHRSLALILDSIYRYHGEQTQASFERWGDKTPLNVYGMDHISAVFPDAQFINLVRDGADVVSSMLVKSGHNASLSEAAKRWTTSLHAAEEFGQRNRTRYHEVRYEALVSDPSAIVEQVCGFLDIGFRSSMIDALDHIEGMPDVGSYAHHRNARTPIHTGSVGRGRETLSHSQREELQTLIGSDLRRWGYGPAV
jgi:hypothetical protein